MDRSEIRNRIENWAAWSRGGMRTGGGCMTGTVCDSMRRAALGDVSSGHGAGRKIDAADADLVERAWKSLAPKHKEMLRWHYIRAANLGMICRRLGIKPRPTSIFDIELARAEAALGGTLLQMSACDHGVRICAHARPTSR